MTTESRESPRQRRTLFRRSSLLTTLLYIGITLLMLFWGLQENLEIVSSERCDLRSSNASSGFFMTRLYPVVLRHLPVHDGGKVAVVALDDSLGYLQQNVCTARAFTADLLTTIAARRPKVIALDKYYGISSCPPGDDSTRLLGDTISSLPMPVVAGKSTHAPKTAGESCMVLNGQLNLGPNAHLGLLRLNDDVLRLPLSWPVLQHDTDTETAGGDAGLSFSYVTARLADPGLEPELTKNGVVSSSLQPYIHLALDEAEPTTARDVMCRWNVSAAAKWKIDCTGVKAPSELGGKVVVIGAESETDYQPVLDGHIYGFQLQARYIEALLDRTYVRQIPVWFMILLLIVYYGLAELVIPYLHIHHHVPFPLFRIHHWTLLWLVGAWALVMAAGFGVPLLCGRFPPLPLLIGISFILIPRLLIEAWELVNEHSEEQRKEHTHEA